MMRPNVNRRHLISGIGVVLVSLVSGCLSPSDNGESPQGTAELPVRFWLKKVSLSTSEQESANPIVFAELSPAEQEIVHTALNERDYTAEPGSESPALESLRDRIGQRTGNGATSVAYLRRENIYYRVGFADGDHIIADPDQ